MKTVKYLNALDIADRLAAKTGLSIRQVCSLLQAQAEIGFESAREGFEIPGIGVLVAVDRPEREIIMHVGPNAGQRVTQPASITLRFYVSEVAKDVFTRNLKAPGNIFELELFKGGELEVP
jgi:hypothetical protein